MVVVLGGVIVAEMVEEVRILVIVEEVRIIGLLEVMQMKMHQQVGNNVYKAYLL